MSTSDRVRAILGGTIQAYRGEPAYRQRADVFYELDRIGARLSEPIRIALAGTLKAGKSTLVNALVGDDIAPTDATEATRIVTGFRHGPTPRVTANHRGGRRVNVPITHRDGLSFDLRRLNPAEIADLDVEWPAEELVNTTIIDTPRNVVAEPGYLRTHVAAVGARGRGAQGGCRGLPAANPQRRGYRAAQTDWRLGGGLGGSAGHHWGRLTGR